MKILPTGAELFCEDRPTDRQTDRQTDKTKLILAFRNFAKAPAHSPSARPNILTCFE